MKIHIYDLYGYLCCNTGQVQLHHKFILNIDFIYINSLIFSKKLFFASLIQMEEHLHYIYITYFE